MLSLILRSNSASVEKILEKHDSFGYTPLLFAISQCNEFAVRTLLDAGANPAVRMSVSELGGNCSVLHLAAFRGFDVSSPHSLVL